MMIHERYSEPKHFPGLVDNLVRPDEENAKRTNGENLGRGNRKENKRSNRNRLQATKKISSMPWRETEMSSRTQTNNHPLNPFPLANTPKGLTSLVIEDSHLTK